MRRSWATSGADLHLDLDRRQIRSSLEASLRDAVRSGRLASGTVLPSSRSLALDLDVARNTVVEVYGQLVEEGWLSARSGSATVVTGPPTSPGSEGSRRSEPQALRSVEPYPRLGTHDLRPGWPDLSSFPRRDWINASRHAIDTAPTEAFGYFEPRGRPELRTALEGYLSRTRGVRVAAEHIVVTLGTTQGLALIGKAMRRRGASVWATESHGFPAHAQRAAAQGFTVHTAPVDDDGIDVAALGVADVVHLCPAHQFPLGAALSAGRRHELLQWSADTGAVVVEDDYDGEFRYDRRPLGALQALAPDQVVYAGTTSKSLGPGLRLGWLVVPPALLDDVVDVRNLADGHNGSPDQLTMAALLGSGAYDRHIRRSRLRYRRRRDTLLAALQSQVPRVRVAGIAAGLHVTLYLPGGVTEDAVVERARHHGLTVEGLQTYALGQNETAASALVIGYATPPDHAYLECLRRLVLALRESGA